MLRLSYLSKIKTDQYKIDFFFLVHFRFALNKIPYSGIVGIFVEFSTPLNQPKKSREWYGVRSEGAADFLLAQREHL